MLSNSCLLLLLLLTSRSPGAWATSQPECPFPCLPPPIGPGTPNYPDYPPPTGPGTPEYPNYPPPLPPGFYPTYPALPPPPPGFYPIYPAPPPPNPITPWFPWYNRSSNGAAARPFASAGLPAMLSVWLLMAVIFC